jgi:hypothetical protein
MQVVDPEPGIGQASLRWVPEHLLVLRTDVERGARVVDRVLVDHHGQLLDEGPVVLLGLAEPELGLLAAGHVDAHALPRALFRGGAGLGDPGVVMHPHDPAVLGDHPILEGDRSA